MGSSLNDECRDVLELLNQEGIPPLSRMSTGGAKGLFDEMNTFEVDPEPVQQVQNFTIEGSERPIPVRVYKPDHPAGAPVLVYFHGGGWVVGNLDTHDPFCRRLTNESGCIVVSVGYRTAPEHPFPAAARDAYVATKWAVNNAPTLGGDSDKVGIIGDSAGGNLVAVVSLMARDWDGPSIAHQCMIYPMVNYRRDFPSLSENGEDYLLIREEIDWFWDQYKRSEVDAFHPYAAPLEARSLEGLPSATVQTCGFDPLRDEGIAYADRLVDAGVDVTHINYEGLMHGIITMLVDPDLDCARVMISDASESFLERVE